MKQIWKTKEGIIIPIKDLTDSHLQNIVKMLVRRAREEQIHCPFPSFNSESMAQYYAEREWDALQSQCPEDVAYEMYPIYKHLIREAAKRGVKV